MRPSRRADVRFGHASSLKIITEGHYVGNGELLGMDQVHGRLGAAIADTTLLRAAVTAGFEALAAQPGVDAGRAVAIGTAWVAQQPSSSRAVAPWLATAQAGLAMTRMGLGQQDLA